MSESFKEAAPTELDLLREDLVAFLDGELDAESSRRLEERLAVDPQARGELERLERVWEALDDLPKAESTERFTQTTVELVALKVDEELQTPPPRRARWLAAVRRSAPFAAVFAAVALVAFFAARGRADDPNRGLLEKLPVLEKLDRYRAIHDPEFLESLSNSGLFAKEDRHDGARP